MIGENINIATPSEPKSWIPRTTLRLPQDDGVKESRLSPVLALLRRGMDGFVMEKFWGYISRKAHFKKFSFYLFFSYY